LTASPPACELQAAIAAQPKPSETANTMRETGTSIMATSLQMPWLIDEAIQTTPT
jgi:hypothetical protein